MLPRFTPNDDLVLTPIQHSIAKTNTNTNTNNRQKIPEKYTTSVTLSLRNEFQDSCIRQLLAEFHGVFCDVQSAAKAAAATFDSTTKASTSSSSMIRRASHVMKRRTYMYIYIFF